MVTIKILVGLPASGKTYYANSIKNSSTSVINCDKYKTCDKDTLILRIADYIKYICARKNVTIILDGLFLTEDIVSSMISYFKNTFKQKITYEVEYWIPNRDVCLQNDNGRRDINSVETIKHARIDEMTEERLFELTGIKVKVNIHHTVKKNSFQFFVDDVQKQIGQYSVKNEKYLYSSDWITGISNPELVTLCSEDMIPSDFEELDELLEVHFPNITYLQYKKMKKKCVTIESFDDSDYYTGTTYKARYCCDLEKLYNFIKEIKDV